MRVSAFVLLIILLTWGSGCGIPQQPAPAKALFLLNLEPEVSTRIAALPGCLQLRTVAVQSSFAGTALLYRTGEVTFEKDYYNQFLTAPDQQLNDLLPLRLRSAGVVLCGNGTNSSTKHLILEPHLEALYADFRTPAAPTAVAKMRFVVIELDRSCHCSTVVLDKTVEAAIPLPEKPSAETVVKAMSEAINTVLAQLDTAVKQQYQ